jgi:hypothetical protein
MDELVIGPEGDRDTGADGAEPELFPGDAEVPEAGTTRSNSTGPPR